MLRTKVVQNACMLGSVRIPSPGCGHTKGTSHTDIAWGHRSSGCTQHLQHLPCGKVKGDLQGH